MDEVFDLQKTLLRLLRGWRMLLAVGLVCALLGAGWQLLQNRDILLTGQRSIPAELSVEEQAAYDKAQQTYRAEQKTFRAQMDAYNANQHLAQAAEQQMQTIRQQIRQAEAKTAVFGAAAPEHSFRLSQSVKITVLDTEKSRSNAGALLYQPMLGDTGVCAALAGARGTDLPATVLPSFFTVTKTGDDILTLAVMGDSPGYCTAAMQAVMAYIQNQYAAAEQVIGPHTIQVLTPDSQPVPDPAFYNARLTAEREEGVLATELANQQKLYDTNSALPEAPVPPAELAAGAPTVLGRGSVLKNGLVSAVFGFVGGLAIGVVLLLFVQAMRQKIPGEDALRGRFGLAVLGVIPADRREK